MLLAIFSSPCCIPSSPLLHPQLPLLHPQLTPLLFTSDTPLWDYKLVSPSETRPATKKFIFLAASRHCQLRDLTHLSDAITSEIASVAVISQRSAQLALKQSRSFIQRRLIIAATCRHRLWPKPPEQHHHRRNPPLRLRHRRLRKHANAAVS
jgi:hypothetical protein